MNKFGELQDGQAGHNCNQRDLDQENILHSEISIEGYDLYRDERINTRVGSSEDIHISVKSSMASLAVNV